MKTVLYGDGTNCLFLHMMDQIIQISLDLFLGQEQGRILCKEINIVLEVQIDAWLLEGKHKRGIRIRELKGYGIFHQ